MIEEAVATQAPSDFRALGRFLDSTRNRFVLVSLVVIVAGMAGFFAWYELRPVGVPPGFVFSNGRIEATEIDIATKYAGRIEQVLVREGDTVDAGQVVARMDTSELLAQLHQAQAQERQATGSQKSDQRVADLADTQFGFAASLPGSSALCRSSTALRCLRFSWPVPP